jgi:hypothetical protein
MWGRTVPLSARRRQEVVEWEREGGMDPAERERALAPALAGASGQEAGGSEAARWRRRARARGVGRE